MAMLAEPRRRQKYSTDPRGLNWSKDEQKFGQKLMEKMGWEKGKGLGANEDGRQEHVSVAYKADTRGVGCSKGDADNWIAHQDDFNSLLSSLNADHGSVDQEATETVVQSLEMKSKHTKGRVHYQKFSRGKDLSLRSETDLNCVFGKRKSASKPTTPQAQSSASSSEAEETQSDGEHKKSTRTEHSHGVTTLVHAVSVAEYFAQKMADMKAKAALRSASNDQDAASNAIETQSPGEQSPNSPSNGPSEEADCDDDLRLSSRAKKKKNKKKKTKEPEEKRVKEEKARDDVVVLSDDGESQERQANLPSTRKRRREAEDSEVLGGDSAVEAPCESPAAAAGKATSKGKKCKRIKREKEVETCEEDPQETRSAKKSQKRRVQPTKARDAATTGGTDAVAKVKDADDTHEADPPGGKKIKKKKNKTKGTPDLKTPEAQTTSTTLIGRAVATSCSDPLLLEMASSFQGANIASVKGYGGDQGLRYGTVTSLKEIMAKKQKKAKKATQQKKQKTKGKKKSSAS